MNFIDPGFGVDLGKSVTIDLGDKIDLWPVYYDPDYAQLTWTDDEGNLLGNDRMVMDFQPYRTTKVYLEAINYSGCSVIDSMTIEVNTVHKVYVPSAFSPDGNGINDYFKFYPHAAVEKVNSFSIFDRWGGLIFQEENIYNDGEYKGWDGTINGKKAEIGVYCFLIEQVIPFYSVNYVSFLV